MEQIARGKMLRILSESPKMLDFIINYTHNDIRKILISDDAFPVSDDLLEELRTNTARKLKVDVATSISYLLYFILGLSKMELKIILALAREEGREKDGSGRSQESTS